MNRNVIALLGLGAGLAIGIAARSSDNALLIGAASWVQPIGTLWLNALKMTLVPLVFALVAHGTVALDRSGASGLVLGVTLPILLGLLALGMFGGMLFGAATLQFWPIAVGSAGALQPSAALVPGGGPGLTDMIIALVPTNPVAAASQGALAPIVVFAMIFGFAASRIRSPESETVVRLVHGLADIMMRIVHWVLWLAPVGIFALAIGLALDAGLAVAGFLAHAVVIVTATALLTILSSYLLAWIGGGVPLLRFGRAILGAQTMAAGTTSSAATLPAMIEIGEQRLSISDKIVGAVVPLSVSVFRLSSVAYGGVMLIFFMGAAGLPLDPAKLAVGGALLIIGSASTGGLPGAAIMYASVTASFKFLGLPLEYIPLLIAITALPDMLITVANITADLAVLTIVDRVIRKVRPLAAQNLTAEPEVGAQQNANA